MLEMVAACMLFPGIHRVQIKTSDFLNFYAAGTLVRQGKGAVLYRRETQDPILERLLGIKSPQYFLHPPFEAAALAALSYLSPEHAFVVWTLFSMGLIGLLPLVLKDWVPLILQRPYLPLFGFAFYPVVIALALGQDSVLILFALSLAFRLMAEGEDFWSGMALALAAVKFQYVAIFLFLLLCWRKFRVATGCIIGCACLGGVSILLVGAHGAVEYVAFVRNFNSHLGYGALKPALMVNVRGLLAGMGVTGQWQIAGWAGEALLVLLGAVCARVSPTVGTKNLIFALFVALSLAASPYAFFPDMTILWLPILLAVDYAAGTKRTWAGVSILAACALVFVLPLILVAVGGHRWWNSRIYVVAIAVMLFIGTLAMEILRGARSGSGAENPMPGQLAVAGG